MKRLLTDGWIVTMDAAGSELPGGWVLLEDGFVSFCGDGPPPPADEVVRLGGAVVTRGSMGLGEADGGLPPDELVEELDEVLADTERLAGLADGAWVQVAAAPCSPFSVTGRLMEESAALARRLGLRLHTHLAETVEEAEYCRREHGCTPVEYLAELGWLEGDVWCAHCVHLSDDEVRRFARAGTGVAH